MTNADRAMERASYALQRWVADRIAANDTQIHINDAPTYAVLYAIRECVWCGIEADVKQAEEDIAHEKDEARHL